MVFEPGPCLHLLRLRHPQSALWEPGVSAWEEAVPQRPGAHLGIMRMKAPPRHKHAVNGNPTVEPFPEGMETIMFGMGCFWGVERLFWRLPGVFSTQVGYAGGFTPNPTYHEVCSGLTGHTEVVRVVFSPEDISLEELLKRFWENHDPTQGMRQHNDRGTQYRSAIYTSNPTQQELALKSKVAFQQELVKKSYGSITTEILEGQQFYYAEDYHQQYLKKVPKGYCGLKGTGVSCPIGAKDEL
ncbi:peptide methionine sulfoxide reductase MsrA 1 isoform X1 [Chelmon rostratus]|uniref:peptide methionine sulfoxide reductase MsrA 1 isoform X1 n=1 Tax=Chelmon rostratus TaxID=109905 RepID=UPI001BE6C8E1|nr:peptide methionine sulfoxide reductase MsrA 1 isoform X1 [Chelmon rostratus]XP_041809571.1 peptide methionine sulfoxide reductase MsrA 1 isoform X1 [Chelmon rostratus]